jgi:hypothetical protein
MAVFSEQHQYIFFANPNTASKAIAKTLKAHLAGKSIPKGEMRENGEVIVRKHHCTYKQLVDAGLMTPERLESLFKFTGVRNPFDQMVSKYVKHCSRRDNDPSKYPWLKQAGEVAGAENTLAISNRTHADFLLWLKRIESLYAEVNKLESGPLDFLNRADHVIRFEALQAGFDEVVKRLGVAEPIQIIEFNITAAREEAPKKKRSYKDFYVDESREIVARLFAPVIERFAYSFD